MAENENLYRRTTRRYYTPQLRAGERAHPLPAGRIAVPPPMGPALHPVPGSRFLIVRVYLLAPTAPMTDESEPRIGKLFGLIALYAVLGIPLVAFLWETLNRVIAGNFDLVRIGLSVPIFALLLVLLRYMARATQRITA